MVCKIFCVRKYIRCRILMCIVRNSYYKCLRVNLRSRRQVLLLFSEVNNLRNRNEKLQQNNPNIHNATYNLHNKSLFIQKIWLYLVNLRFPYFYPYQWKRNSIHIFDQHLLYSRLTKSIVFFSPISKVIFERRIFRYVYRVINNLYKRRYKMRFKIAIWRSFFRVEKNGIISKHCANSIFSTYGF